MLKLLHFGLLICTCAAVLFFGGTEPVSWAGVQIVVFLVFGVLLLLGNVGDVSRELPWKGPLLLVIYILARSSQLGNPTPIVLGAMLKPVTYICTFYLALYVSRKEGSHRGLAVALVVLALAEALYGLVQYLADWQYIFTYQKKFYATQATGTYINPNHYAGFLEMTLPLALSLALYRLQRLGWPSPRSSTRANPGLRSERIAPAAFFLFASLLIFLAIVFSRSRMGIFSAAVAVLATGGLWVASSWRRGAAVAVLVTFLAVAALFGIWIGLGPVAERYQAAMNDYHVRLDIWRDTLSLIRAHPLFGTGWGTYVDVYPSVQSTSLLNLVDHAHNDYLEVAADIGIIGAGLVFGLILSVLGRGISAFHRLRQTREGFLVLGTCGSILAILVHSFADFNLQIPANALVLSVILGVSYSISMKTAINESPAPSDPSSRIPEKPKPSCILEVHELCLCKSGR